MQPGTVVVLGVGRVLGSMGAMLSKPTVQST